MEKFVLIFMNYWCSLGWVATNGSMTDWIGIMLWYDGGWEDGDLLITAFWSKRCCYGSITM